MRAEAPLSLRGWEGQCVSERGNVAFEVDALRMGEDKN